MTDPVLDAARLGGDSEPLIDAQRLAKVAHPFGCVALFEVVFGDAFEGYGFIVGFDQFAVCG